MSTEAPRLARATPSIVRGRAQRRFTPENGYTSVRTERAALRIDCGFTIDGELFDPCADETIRLSADRRLRFLRA